MDTLRGKITGIQTLKGIINPEATLACMITVPEIISADHYRGAYTVTPTSQQQTLHTKDLLADDDITIEPIPSNYGLITWDGSTLTVS